MTGKRANTALDIRILVHIKGRCLLGIIKEDIDHEVYDINGNGNSQMNLGLFVNGSLNLKQITNA